MDSIDALSRSRERRLSKWLRCWS